MTNEELERAIDFLLKSQARFDTRLEAYVQEGKERQDRTDEQLSRLSDRVDAFADTQAELMRVLKRSIEEGERFRESQKRINESHIRVHEALAKSQARAEEAQVRAEEAQARVNESLAAGQARTEEALARLADAQAQSERRMNALTKIVEEERGR